MTKKEAMEYSIKMSRKSKIKLLFSVVTIGLAIGNIYRDACNAEVYMCARKDIEDFADDDADITLTFNGKEV